MLWYLEEQLALGRNLYLYSREGHGRVGLIGACLLGRLYAFNAEETLIRVQNSHDCAKRDEGKKILSSCPQLNAHRHLVREVLSNSNRAMKGIVRRSHQAPDKHDDVLDMPKKGTGNGAHYKDLAISNQHPLSEAHSATRRIDTEVDYMSRAKTSLHHHQPSPHKKKKHEEVDRGQFEVKYLPKEGTGTQKKATVLPLLRHKLDHI
jgi:hypothetical protein